MAKELSSKDRNRLRMIIIIVIGVFAFVVSLGMNIIGMKNAINRAPDASGIAGFSSRDENSLVSTKKKTNDEGKIAETDMSVKALPIVFLINSNWDRIQGKFTGFQLAQDGNAVFEDGYIFYCNGKYVNNVIFDNTYEGEIVGNIKVGTNFKTIKSSLGEPTFKYSNCIGYKTREIYVFFYEDKVVVYPNMKISNDKFEKLLLNYQEKEYSNRTRFVVDIKENCEDFKVDQDVQNDIIVLTSTTRQVVLKLDNLGNIEVEFFNGYETSNESIKRYIEKKVFITNEEDLVDIIEKERVSGN